MVNPVVGRCYENIFEPAHFPDQLGMNKNPPDLGGRVNKYNVERPEPKPDQWHKVNKPVQGLKNRGPETNGKIHQIGGMMGYMNGPEKPDLMIKAVKPVIKEVFTKNQQYPVTDPCLPGDDFMIVQVKEDSNIEYPEAEVYSGIQKHQVNITCRVFPAI